MPLSNYQFSYNGYTFGDLQDWNILPDGIEGLDLPDIDGHDQPRFDNHGLVPGRDLVGGRLITINLDTAATTEAIMQARLAALRTATAPRKQPDAELPLTFKLPGEPELRSLCRPRRRSLTIDRSYTMLNPTAILQFAASDPRLYAETETTVSIAAATLSGVANNTGDTSTYPIVEVDGAATNPISIKNVTDGNKTITLITALTSGQTLIVDFFKRTITIGGANKYDLLQAGGRWWELLPGNNTIEITGGGAKRVKFRSAWMGI